MKVVEQLAELRALNVADLEARARELDDKLFRVRLQRSIGQAESGHQLRPLRKELARIKTVLAEKGGKG
jgi:large subunit ribosomal protein L29